MQRITVELIKQEICDEFGIEIVDLISTKHYQRFAVPRHLLFYLTAKLYPNLTLRDLGEVLGIKKHHSTIINSKKIASNLIFTGYISHNYFNILRKLGWSDEDARAACITAAG